MRYFTDDIAYAVAPQDLKWLAVDKLQHSVGGVADVDKAEQTAPHTLTLTGWRGAGWQLAFLDERT